MASLVELGYVSKSDRVKDAALVTGGSLAGSAAGAVGVASAGAAGKKLLDRHADKHVRRAIRLERAGDVGHAVITGDKAAQTFKSIHALGAHKGKFLAAGGALGGALGSWRSMQAADNRSRLRDVGKAFGMKTPAKKGFANLMKPKGVPKATKKPIGAKAPKMGAPKPLTPPKPPAVPMAKAFKMPRLRKKPAARKPFTGTPPPDMPLRPKGVTPPPPPPSMSAKPAAPAKKPSPEGSRYTAEYRRKSKPGYSFAEEQRQRDIKRMNASHRAARQSVDPYYEWGNM